MTILAKRTKPVLLAVIVLLFVVVGLVLLRGNASAEAMSANSSFPIYTPPSGPEMTIEEAAGNAIKFARNAGVKGEVQVQIVHGTLARSKAVMEGQPVSAAEERESELSAPTTSGAFCFPGGGVTCSATEVAQAKKVLLEEAQSGAYLAILTAAEVFRPVETVRPGNLPVYAKSMALIINSHTGAHEGLDIGGNQEQALSELGRTARFSYGPEPGTAQATSHSERPPRGILTGTVKLGRRPVSGWRVAVTNEFGTNNVTTKLSGKFQVRLHPGRYVVTVRRPNGGVCAKRSEQIKPNRETRMIVTCR